MVLLKQRSHYQRKSLQRYRQMLTILTENLGKVSVSARNSRKAGAVLPTGIDLWQYVLFREKIYFLNGCDV